MKTNEWTDPIVDEIHAVRKQLAKAVDYDVKKFFAYLREAEQQHPERLVDRVVREPRRTNALREAREAYGGQDPYQTEPEADFGERRRPWSDPILDEIHAIRAQMAKEADYDVHKYVEQLRESEKRRSEGLADRESEEPRD